PALLAEAALCVRRLELASVLDVEVRRPRPDGAISGDADVHFVAGEDARRRGGACEADRRGGDVELVGVEPDAGRGPGEDDVDVDGAVELGRRREDGQIGGVARGHDGASEAKL